MRPIKQIFYGWKIVLASVIILAVGLGMFNSTNSVFVIPVCSSLGCSRSQFTLHRTIITLTSACLLPFFSKVIVRLGVKKTLLTGSIMLGSVIIGFSFAGSLWHFYLLAFVYGIFYSAVNFMIIGILIGRWFDDRKGLAIGLAYSGSGLGSAVMIPVLNNVIERTDWRFAYRFLGAVGLAILIPIVIIVIHETPEKIGLKPFTSEKTDRDRKKEDAVPYINLSLSQSTRTIRFWLLLTAFFLITVFAASTNTHSTPFLQDLGYPGAKVSTVISLFMVFLTVGKILLGLIYDRFGAMAGNLFIIACSLVFPVAALLSHIPLFPWIYAVTVGTASCGVSVPLPILITRYFGKKDYPAIFSLFTMTTTLGMAVSVPAMGAVYDFTGSYRPAWAALFIFSIIISICLILPEIAYRKGQAKLG